MDILNAFVFQLNRRFDALISQCQQLRFDFMKCHKDDFRLCIGFLPAYIDKIIELSLSDQNAPSQVYTFLSFFHRSLHSNDVRNFIFMLTPNLSIKELSKKLFIRCQKSLFTLYPLN